MTLVRLVEGKPEVRADDWVHVSDDAPLPDGAAAIVSLERWKSERDRLARRNLPMGVRLESRDRPEAIAGDLPRLALIALDFPNLNDGRAFSVARLLRERYGYRGELRAVGQVLRDQLFQMARCGFESFELRDSGDPDDVLAAFSELTVFYQPAADRPATERFQRPP